MEEIWKDIPGYEGLYQASNLGRVKTFNYLGHGKVQILKPNIGNSGYKKVCLTKDGIEKTFNLHRLIAMTFIPNKENKPCIDHINTDRTDNRVENLRWVTHRENCNNALTRYHISLVNKGKIITDDVKKKISEKLKGHTNSFKRHIIQLTLDGQFIKEWQSLISIKKELGLNNKNVCSCCRGQRNKVGGYKWLYKEDYEQIYNRD